MPSKRARWVGKELNERRGGGPSQQEHVSEPITKRHNSPSPPRLSAYVSTHSINVRRRFESSLEQCMTSSVVVTRANRKHEGDAQAGRASRPQFGVPLDLAGTNTNHIKSVDAGQQNQQARDPLQSVSAIVNVHLSTKPTRGPFCVKRVPVPGRGTKGIGGYGKMENDADGSRPRNEEWYRRSEKN